jgi:hypothetical protein
MRPASTGHPSQPRQRRASALCVARPSIHARGTVGDARRNLGSHRNMERVHSQSGEGSAIVPPR